MRKLLGLHGSSKRAYAVHANYFASSEAPEGVRQYASQFKICFRDKGPFDHTAVSRGGGSTKPLSSHTLGRSMKSGTGTQDEREGDPNSTAAGHVLGSNFWLVVAGFANYRRVERSDQAC